MSSLILEPNVSCVDVMCVSQADEQQSLAVVAAASASGTGLDLRQLPRGCSGAEGQSVRKGLCKMPLLQERVRV